jgi:hypothetical protein
MKKVIIALALALTTTAAMADPIVCMHYDSVTGNTMTSYEVDTELKATMDMVTGTVYKNIVNNSSTLVMSNVDFDNNKGEVLVNTIMINKDDGMWSKTETIRYHGSVFTNRRTGSCYISAK